MLITMLIIGIRENHMIKMIALMPKFRGFIYASFSHDTSFLFCSHEQYETLGVKQIKNI